jgi:hypothetical protein
MQSEFLVGSRATSICPRDGRYVGDAITEELIWPPGRMSAHQGQYNFYPEKIEWLRAEGKIACGQLPELSQHARSSRLVRVHTAPSLRRGALVLYVLTNAPQPECRLLKQTDVRANGTNSLCFAGNRS